ncbi:MAG: hypothetical protein H8E44_46000 [Planctomycetes bacterium]|nr:hypothetical protein [Planctomycetota bacterium]MBL7041965.1 hypothetical protein [Pirellulaceae bacterium]
MKCMASDPRCVLLPIVLLLCGCLQDSSQSQSACSGNAQQSGAASSDAAKKEPAEDDLANLQERQAQTESSEATVGGAADTAAVTRQDLDAWIARFDDTSIWHYGERTDGELAGLWTSVDANRHRIVFGADGSFSEDFLDNMTTGLYAISDKGRIAAVSKWKGIGCSGHFWFDGKTITGPKGPNPKVRWERTRTTK